MKGAGPSAHPQTHKWEDAQVQVESRAFWQEEICCNENADKEPLANYFRWTIFSENTPFMCENYPNPECPYCTYVSLKIVEIKCYKI